MPAVAAVIKGSPAVAAGLQAGDRIVTVDGLRVLVHNLEALNGTPIIDVKPVIGPPSER